jgi:hypothetical protein
MRPIADAERHDAPGMIDELVPSIGAMIDDIRVGTEHSVGQPVVAHELPDILDGVQFRTFRRQRQERDVGRHIQAIGLVLTRLLDQHHGVRARRDGDGDLGEMQVHRGNIASRQDEGCSLAILRANCAKDVGGGRALVVWCRRPCPAQRPASGDLVLLPNAGFISKPDLYVITRDVLLARDRAIDLRMVARARRQLAIPRHAVRG